MPSTTNFGWTTPADTDLVKDGAAAIRTLGNGVDASFVDLKGGTTGQVLSKNSNTDLDFTWIAVDPLTILDAKADLITATAADTPARLAVGTNGQVLTADSSTSTGLKWATPSAGATIATVRKSADQSVTNSSTLVDDDELSFSIGANETYIVNVWLYTYAANNTPHIQYGFSAPSGATTTWSPSSVYGASSGASLATAVTGTGTLTGYVDQFDRASVMTGTIKNSSTAGTVKVRWAQQVASATSTTVKAGSYIFAIKVA